LKECPLCRACADDAVGRCPDDGASLEPTISGPRLLDGKYELERRLGEGGMGVVYRGRHVNLHRQVAIKFIAGTAEGLGDRFRIEAAALGRLKHPHIVDVMDFGVEEARGIAYLVMELLEGATLATRCASHPLDRSDAIRILEQVAAGVDFAHDHGILHRDLKPANIFLARSNAGAESIKILDFGLAQFVHHDAPLEPGSGRAVPTHSLPPALGSADTTTMVASYPAPSPDHGRIELLNLQPTDRRILVGTQAYMAPELFRLEPATPASDVYALGVLAYQMLTGALPSAIPATPATVPPPSRVGYKTPAELDSPVMRLLEPVPSQRPSSARTAIAAIDAADRAARAREWRDREHPRRRMAAIALGVFGALAAPLWTAPPLDRVERSIVDARFAAVSLQAPHPAILLVVLGDQDVDADARPLALRADEFGATLSRVFDVGARAVAVDLLLPQTWSRSAPFAQLVARHADRLTLGAVSTVAGTVLGPECLPGLVSELLGSERASALFGFVNLNSDADGVTRHARLHYRDAEGQLRPTWSARAASTAGATLLPDRDGDRIDYTVDSSQFHRVSWRDVARLADSAPEIFRDRIVLVGGEFTGSGDEHRPTPGRSSGGRPVSGLVVQAFIVNTMLNGFPIRDSRRWPMIVGACFASGGFAFLVLTRRRLIPVMALAIGLIGVYAAAAFAVFVAERTVWPVAGPTLVVALVFGVALIIRARWAGPPERLSQT
jgi:serine/threonine-protein kinase